MDCSLLSPRTRAESFSGLPPCGSGCGSSPGNNNHTHSRHIYFSAARSLFIIFLHFGHLISVSVSTLPIPAPLILRHFYSLCPAHKKIHFRRLFFIFNAKGNALLSPPVFRLPWRSLPRHPPVPYCGLMVVSSSRVSPGRTICLNFALSIPAK